MSVDQQFNNINTKLQQLLKQYSRLQKENENLNAELQDMKLKQKATGDKMQELQQQISVLKVASGEMTERDKKEFEKTLNQYIKQVDKCISFLSE